MESFLYKRARELLFDRVDAETIRQWLLPVGITDWRTAHRRLLHIAEESQARPALANLLPYLLLTLKDAANPDQVLVSLERFLRSVENAKVTLTYLARNPRAAEILVTLFAGSAYLTETLLRKPEYFELLVTHQRLTQAKSVEQFRTDSQTSLGQTFSKDFVQQLDALRSFQRWELLRIGACDLLDLFDLPAVTSQLANLADSLVQTCLSLAAEQVGIDPTGFVVLAMGKLGGRELNYSSDIDLLFLAQSSADNYRKLAQRLIKALTQVTSEGFLYRVDMRLRPWGQSGALVTSVDGYITYLRKHARLWEKQALLKARAIAGDQTVGEVFLHRATPLIFDSPPEAVRADVFAMKQRTENHLQQSGRQWGEVKLGAGSIRDVEFVTQYLQLVYGAQHPQIRSRTTLDALDRILAYKLLPADDYHVLTEGYVFLRTIEHHLQMMHYRQTHTLPQNTTALAHLAQRLGFQEPNAGEQFLARYEQHRTAIRAVYLHYLGGDRMNAEPTHQKKEVQQTFSSAASPKQNVSEHVSRLGQSYTETFNAEEIEHHAILANALNSDNQVEVQAVPLDDGGWRLTIVAYDYLGELSLICGLIFVNGCTILDGNVFTYEPAVAPPTPRRRTSLPRKDTRRKIVDVFTVYPEHKTINQETWQQYAKDLADLLRLMHIGKRREARGKLAKRWTTTLRETASISPALYPVEIQIDNESSEKYTLLHIDALDTSGFLYEFTNALAYSRVYIARMTVDSVGKRVHDTLYVTDANGRKITTPEKQRQLRVASVLIKHFTHLLPQSPNPESALLHFREFIGQLFRRDDWPDELASLERQEVLNALARLLGVSDFLWEDFLRMQHENLFPIVRDVDALDTMKSREQLQAELEQTLHPVHNGPQPPSDDAPWRKTLNAFKDREMFRIDMRHILGHTKEFDEFSEELTALAEVVVNSAYHLCHEDLRTVYGTPCLDNGDVSEMVVCALGKCGGYELGFASDIELMFLYSGNGQTTGPHVISTAEFYEKLVQTFIQVIRAKREGIFEIDLQLRPYGKSGSMSVSLEAFQRYYAPDGPAWAYERQALVKLRHIAGNTGLGQHVQALRDEFVYTETPFDVTAMRAMRERQVRHSVSGGTFNAKYSPGGLVDIEYLIQGLQITYGHQNPALRLTNMRAAMAALTAAGILTADEHTRLRKAHTFLRWLIDGLRMVHGNTKELTVPLNDEEALAFLTRRLRYGHDVTQFREELMRYTTDVQMLNTQLLG